MKDNHLEIMQAIGILQGTANGINTRLDILNGRVTKHDEQIANLRIEGAVGKTKIGIIGALGGLLATAILKVIFRT